MLLVVMLLFLLTEMPQGLLTGLSLIYGPEFFTDCYMQLADPMDLLALINSTINFVLYCAMSVQFRYTFASMYCGCCSRRKSLHPSPSTNCASVSYYHIRGLLGGFHRDAGRRAEGEMEARDELAKGEME
ncbi:uncharacterized protein LOC119578601 [Penaeus monodon]|uniref:uncharacterized protein LOC119578601 n=1 Tax=Penaeus monodon TaxID=6687 RepID=UPI0018A6F00C|nr:uncharacterized protein LOC119578601 [Penaeus monodon]